MSTIPPPPPVVPPQGAACKVCGQHTLIAKADNLTAKKRTKFGIMWLLVCIISVGFGLILYLVWPRKTVVIGVDRYMQCTSCGSRQV